jgi:transcriptional regulator with XRE-family HTH domain
MNISDAIKEQRLDAGMTLQYVEKQTGISNQNLSRWENGKAIPGIDFCITLANFYGCTLDELVGVSDTPQNKSSSTLPQKIDNKQISFVKEFESIIDDDNYINISKLCKNISPTLRALTLGYIVGLLQNNGVDTKEILGY